jgi:eukaryotic-like serine/threonine-protein kinase
MEDIVGTTLKKQYFLRSLAGSGGMADVYLAWDKLRSAKMAVKVLRRDLAENKKFTQAFEAEAGVLEKLQHPYIVRLYEFARERDIVFIVMAWVDGMDLKKRIVNLKRPLSLADAGRILEPICSALNFAHQNGTFHCDIKPSNILLHENERDVFLADFGVARVAQEQGGGGTLPYMAPEQFAQETIGAQTDIYALGITLYEMLSGGVLPYRGETSRPGTTTRDRFAYEHIYVPVPSIGQFNSSLPQGVIDVLQKALKKNQTDRFKSTLDFYNAFEQARGAIRATERAIETEHGSTIFEPAAPASAQSSQVQKPASAPNPIPSAGISRPPASLPFAGKKGTSYLFIRSGEGTGQSIYIPTQTGLTIGRGTACSIRLHERSVSRLHATIFTTKRGVFVRDEGSSFGTFLNHQRIPSGLPLPVKQGDVIQIGYYQVFEIRLK